MSDFIKRKKDENAVNTNEDKEDDDINPDYIDWWARFHISLQVYKATILRIIFTTFFKNFQCASIEDLQNQTALEKAYKFKVNLPFYSQELSNRTQV